MRSSLLRSSGPKARPPSTEVPPEKQRQKSRPCSAYFLGKHGQTNIAVSRPHNPGRYRNAHRSHEIPRDGPLRRQSRESPATDMYLTAALQPAISVHLCSSVPHYACPRHAPRPKRSQLFSKNRHNSLNNIQPKLIPPALSARGARRLLDGPAGPPSLRRKAGLGCIMEMQAPQLPKSIWYLTDARFLGMRLARPVKLPPAKQLYQYWSNGVEKE